MISWRFQAVSELPSTSDYCIERAKEGEPAGLAVFAHRQSAGRGSRGRQWLSPPGNLAFSVLLRPAIAPADSSIFPLLAAVAVAQAVRQFLPRPATMLKWPNDILLGDAKLAGLLIDAAPLEGRIDWLVIGIGMNIAHAPDIPGRLTTALGHHMAPPAPLVVAQAILARLSAWLTPIDIGKIHASWLASAHPVGTALEVRGPNQTTAGSFAGLSPAGELLLLVENRIEKFQTGEILLGATG